MDELKQHLTIPTGVTASSIADGHREKTLALLWTIVFHFKVHIHTQQQTTGVVVFILV